MTEPARGSRVAPLWCLCAVLFLATACDDEQPLSPAQQVATLQLTLEDTLRVSTQTTRLDAMPVSEEGMAVEGASVEFESSDRAVAEVDSDGTVRALAGGEAWLRASVTGRPEIRDSVHLTVKQAGSVKWVAEGVEVAHHRQGAIALGPAGNVYARNHTSTNQGGAVSVSPEGEVRWKNDELPDITPYLTPIMVRQDGAVVIADETSRALDPETGAVLWENTLTGTNFGDGPAALGVDGGLYTQVNWRDIPGAEDASIGRIAPDGTLAWFFEHGGDTGGPFGVSLDGSGEVITLLGLGHDDHAAGFSWIGMVDPASGDLMRRADPDFDNPLYDRFPHPGFTAWVGDRDGHLFCLCEPADRAELVRLDTDLSTLSWSVPATGARATEPILGPDGSIYFIDGDEIVGVNGDGSRRWAVPWDNDRPTGRTEPGQSMTLTADGTLYAPLGREVVALDAATGDQIWRMDLTEIEDRLQPTREGWGAVAAPAVSDDGTIYLAVQEAENGVVALWGPSPLADAPWPTYRADNQRTGRVNMGGGG